MINKIRNNTFARNSLILFAGAMVANVLNYVFHLALGRLVSVETYGEIESLLSLTVIISVPALALGMVATKYSAGCKAENDPGATRGLIQYLNKKIVIYCLPIFLILFIATPWVAQFLRIKSSFSLVLVWLIMLLSFFSAITGGIVNGWQKFESSNWIGIWGAIVKLLAAVILIKIGFTLNGAIGGFFLGSVVSYLVSLWALKFVFRRKDKNTDQAPHLINFSSIKKYVIPVLVGNLAIVILGNADMVLAKHSLDAMAAGQYGALTIVSKIIFYATGIMATVLFTMSAEDNHKNNDSFHIFRNALYLMSAVSVLAILVYFMMPNFIMSLLFGHKYTAVSMYLGWLAIVVVLYSFVNLIFQYLMSIHETKVSYALLFISLLSAIVILLFGHSIFAIIAIVGLGQLLAVGACLIYLFVYKKTINSNIKTYGI